MSEANRDPLVKTSEGPRESLEFLVGSWNRFEVLSELRSGPRTRDELRELTGVSRSTLSRILSDLIDRGWMVRRNDEFNATPKGDVIVAELTQLIDNIETAETLEDTLAWLPPDKLGFDLGHLADATVLTPSPENHTAPMSQLIEQMTETTEMRLVATGVTPKIVDAICRSGLAGDLTLSCVLDEQAFSGLRNDTDFRQMFRTMIEREQCEAYRYDGDDDLLDINLIDDAVMFCGHSDNGPPPGVVISDNDTVMTWAAVTFEECRSDSVPVGVDAFTV